MAIALPDLPYALDALEPHMSEKTLQFHYGKHHKGYVDKTNGMIEGTEFENLALEDIIQKSAIDQAQAGLFNNSAQVWNHTFFWNCMSPNGGPPSGDIAKALDKAFGGLDSFKKEFAAAATGRFGSGWAWVVLNDGKLEIMSTPNADTPMVKGLTPLLTCDVWEHAYYLDYQNARAKFVEVFLDKLVNWEFVAEQLAEAHEEKGLSAA
jgi:Fe-Mn family superoxide dismutase